jgi:hypothetical protein
LAVARAKLGVALGTRRIRRGLQKHCTLVLNMARGTLGRECLISVVQGSIVAREASLVSHLRCERASFGNVAERALLREHGVSTRKLPTGIHFLPAMNALCDKPSRGEQRDRQGQPETPTPKGVRVREVLQVNALGELLGCSCPS